MCFNNVLPPSRKATKSQMSDLKQEIRESQLLDMIESTFRKKILCFKGHATRAHSRTFHKMADLKPKVHIYLLVLRKHHNYVFKERQLMHTQHG